MAKFFQFPKELLKYDFIGLYNKEKNAKLKIKFLALSYLKEGLKLSEVSERVHVTYQTVASWVSKIQLDSITGLLDKPKGHRASVLAKSQYEEFKEYVLQLYADSQKLIARDIQQLLEEKFDVTCCVATIYNLLAAVGLEWMCSRNTTQRLV